MILDEWILEKQGLDSSDGEMLGRWQLEQLGQLVALVKRESTFYRRLYEGVVTPRTWEDFRRLPFVDDRMLAEQGLSMLCVSQGEISRVVTLATSGTAGMPKRVFFTREDQELTVDYFHHGMGLVARPGGTTAVFLPCRPTGNVGDLLLGGLSRLGVRGIGFGRIRSLAEAVGMLKEQKIDSFVATPMEALALSCYVREHFVKLSLDKILLSTDYLAEAVRRRIARDLDCEVYDHFGITEAGLGAAIDCAAHRGMHIRENDLFFETVEPGGTTVLPDGMRGELVLTTLTRRGMPLIRYRTGDYGVLSHGRCACGSCLTRLQPAGGRIDNEIRLSKGCLSMNDLDELLFAMEGLMDFRAGYDREEVCLHLHLRWYRYLPQNLEEQLQQIRDALWQRAGLKSKLSAEAVGDICPCYPGKRTILKEGET